jgi:hypothetical protein
MSDGAAGHRMAKQVLDSFNIKLPYHDYASIANIVFGYRGDAKAYLYINKYLANETSVKLTDEQLLIFVAKVYSAYNNK